MKLTKTHRIKASKSGMTLLELTVVILVLLSLISILFIGARAWKRGSDRAASILTIRNVQQAVRSFSNMNQHNPGDTVELDAEGNGTTLVAEVFGEGKFIENNPTDEDQSHPAGVEYSYAYTAEAAGGNTIPEVGFLYLEVTGPDDAAYFMPKSDEIGDW